MSFNLGSSDRMPAFGGNKTSSSGGNPLQQAVNPANNRGGDMVLTPDNPSWHGSASQSQPMLADSSQNAHHNPHGGTSSIIGGPDGSGRLPLSGPGLRHDPSTPYSGGRANTGNNGPFRAGPDNHAFLPPGAVPQGARFDPIMPEGSRQEFSSRGTGASRPGQNPPGFASGEPDYDELLPPN
ncbi:hypothetical protein EMPS_06978 [Entomortierella parvispora]|uniref:Uncharacterized protein n=1 Tax=Entomortierella parvispora TaxID=205924 RepID=A0A9P3LY89_9FUNG|nr:hypothetical protein EMPS_06978 [Entomortierella parvispora]